MRTFASNKVTARPPKENSFSSHARVGNSPHASHEHITSTANPRVKMLKGLDRKKIRNETNLFLAEGARLIQEAIDHSWAPEYMVIAADSLERDHVKELANRAEAAGATILTTTNRVMASIARKDNPQTVICAFPQRLSSLEDITTKGPQRFIALYEIRDPGNLGTILRTADAAGVDGVILVEQCCDPFSVEAVRATMGAIFSIPICSVSTSEFDAWRSTINATTTAASVNGEFRHDEADFGDKAIILMGNEQSGIPEHIEATCENLVRIPMAGAADSLNLAQATAIMTYEVWRSKGYDGADR